MRALWLLLFVPSAAVADGAFPNALQALTRASDPQHIYLGTTFGLVFTEDAGASWRYVCEPYVTGGANVSLYALEADGTLLAVSDKLTRSTDGGCTWSTIDPPAGAHWLDAFADPADATRVLAAAWTASGSSVWISHDGGQTFPTKLLDTTAGIISVESSVSNPASIYAASAGTAFFASTDNGDHWQQSTVPGTSPIAVRILAVSPTDANTVWLRATNPARDTDTLLVTSDGGQHFKTLLVWSSLFSGFAHATDGTLYVADGNDDLQYQSPGAAAFQSETIAPHLLCLSLSGSQMLGCGDGLRDPYNLASSSDFGKSWKPLLNFSQIQGPATCSQVQTACASDWQYQQTVFASYAPKKSGCSSADPGALMLILLAAHFISRSRASRR